MCHRHLQKPISKEALFLTNWNGQEKYSVPLRTKHEKHAASLISSLNGGQIFSPVARLAQDEKVSFDWFPEQCEHISY